MGDQNRESWGSKIGFILSTAGFSVGIGNIWRFPNLVGQYGGAVFIVVYLIFLFLFGIILFSAELTIGRAGQANATQLFAKITGKPKSGWSVIGGLGLIAVAIICSYAIAVVGWALAFVFKSLAGSYSGMGADEIGKLFGGFIGSYESILWSLAVTVILVLCVAQGLRKGVERVSKVLMPGLFIILFILLIRTFTLKNAWEGLAFYFRPDFSKLSWDLMFAALGQIFFSIGIGMGVGLVYGSYLSKESSIPTECSKIALIDTGVAMFAGMVVVPSAMAFGIDPGVGAGLAFVSMPNVFNHMVMGRIVGTGFYLMLFIAGLTSIIAGTEALTNWITEHCSWQRKQAVYAVAAVFFIVSVFCTLGFGPWSSFTIAGKDILSALDFFASNLCLPIGAFLMTVFVIYVWGFDKFKAEANTGIPGFLMVGSWWKFFLQFIIPIFLVVIFIKGLGII